MKQIFITILLACSFSTMQADPPRSINLNYANNRYPLISKPYIELPIGTIKPTGWLQEQLKRMVTGMTGNLDTLYEPVMGKRNGWLGGDGDVWERAPYWIDGLLPLAYIMNDKALIAKVQPWIEWAIASQKENGYFGPEMDRGYEKGLQRGNAKDWWPKMVMLKVLQQYYSATKDERVIKLMTNYFKYQLKQLPIDPLGKWTFWGEQRGADNLMVVYWLYSITGDAFLLDLGELVHKQTLNWTDIFINQNHLSRQHSLHCVNLAQGFKAPMIYFQASKDHQCTHACQKAIKDMRHTIALPTGLWAGDELLRFGDPTLGSELCTAAEMMFSLEKMLEISGDIKWADQLERIAYNVLPSQISDDFSVRQYYSQINQIAITKESRNFVTPHAQDDNVMGLLTGYPCCTSNLHQTWPKFTQNLWYATADNGIAALVYAPSEVTAKVANGVEVKILEETNYPFDSNIQFKINIQDNKIKKVLFPMHVRIPSWCVSPEIYLNGTKLNIETKAGIAIVNREWSTGDQLSLEFPMKVAVNYWYDGGAVIERGPLLYALRMNETWIKKFDEKTKTFYNEVTSDSPWNFCLMSNNLKEERLQENFKVTQVSKIATYPWTLDDAPITISTKANSMVWTKHKGSTGPIAYFTQHHTDQISEEETIQLIPFGCTTLRIAQFPVRDRVKPYGSE